MREDNDKEARTKEVYIEAKEELEGKEIDGEVCRPWRRGSYMGVCVVR